MNEEVIITIAEDGVTTVKVQGHAGPGCKGLTEGLEEALGEVVSDELTPEHAQQPQRNATARTAHRQNATNRR